MNIKICYQCGKPGEFQIRSDTGSLRNECKKCTSLYKKEHRKKNKEHIAAVKSQYYQNNKQREKIRIAKWTKDNRCQVLTKKKEFYEEHKDRYLEKDLQKKYGISLADYSVMLENQDGACAICKKPETSKIRGNIRRLAVDHCHETNKIRALLCTKCNNALGGFKDSPQLLETAAKYLRSHGK